MNRDVYWYTSEYIKKIEKTFNDFLNNPKKKIKEGFELGCEQFATKFRKESSNKRREDVILDFVSFMKEMKKFQYMEFLLNNSIIQYGTKGIKISIAPYDELSFRRKPCIFQSERLKELKNLKMEYHSVYELSLYGISGDICKKLDEAGYTDTDALYDEYIHNRGKNLTKIKGIGNGQIRKIKNVIMNKFLIDDINPNESDDVDLSNYLK